MEFHSLNSLERAFVLLQEMTDQCFSPTPLACHSAWNFTISFPPEQILWEQSSPGSGATYDQYLTAAW